MRNESQKSKNSVRVINEEAEKPLLTYNDLEEEEKVDDITQLLTTPRVTMMSLKSSGMMAANPSHNPFGTIKTRKATAVNPLKNMMSP